MLYRERCPQFYQVQVLRMMWQKGYRRPSSWQRRLLKLQNILRMHSLRRVFEFIIQAMCVALKLAARQKMFSRLRPVLFKGADLARVHAQL